MREDNDRGTGTAMRFLFLVPGVLSPELGVSQVALNLSNALRRLGHRVELRNVRADQAEPARWWRALEADQTAAAALVAAAGSVDVIDAPAHYLSASMSGRACLVARSVQPDLAYLAVSASESGRRPIAQLRWVVHSLYNRRIERAIRKGWRLADRILCLGSAEAEVMAATEANLREKLTVYLIAPCSGDRLQMRELAARRTRERVCAAEASYLWIGRWTAHKGPNRLVAFAREFLAKHPSSRLTLAGTGETPTTGLPADLIADGRIRIVPRFERAELFDLLGQHDAGLFTSEVEGWGLSLQEMLEAGLPVYATLAGAVSDLESWFPSQLRTFPPDPTDILPEPDTDTFAGYAERFNWERTAADYIQAVIGQSTSA